jgi:hypothetical protein
MGVPGLKTHIYALILGLALLGLHIPSWAWRIEPKEITEVRVAMHSGPILPELKEYREIIITPGQVLLVLQGSGAHAQTGEWKFRIAEEDISTFFTELASLDYSQVQRIAPDITPDGGHTKSYTISYPRGPDFTLFFTPGVEYTHSEPIVQHINTYITSLDLWGRVKNTAQNASQ